MLSAGITDAQEPYLVFQYCPGLTLHELLSRSGTLEEKLFLAIFTQMADALAAAHRSGIFHRDIKPSNILLDQSLSQAMLGDFGTATIVTADSVDQKLTATGHMIGTPAYMSAEQCLSQKVDARSDVYSLGCVMYECLCGQPPLLGATPLETMSLHCQQTESPPLPASVSRTIRKTVSRCLSPDPQKRPTDAATARAMLLDQNATTTRILTTLFQHPARNSVLVLIGVAIFGILLRHGAQSALEQPLSPDYIEGLCDQAINFHSQVCRDRIWPLELSKTIDKAVARAPKEPLLHLANALKNKSFEQYKIAHAEASTCLKTLPADSRYRATALALRADIAKNWTQDKTKLEQALSDINQALAIKEDTGWARTLIYIELSLSHLEDAYKHAHKLTITRKKDSEGPFLCGRARECQGRWREASKHYMEAGRRFQTQTASWLAIARCHLQLGEFYSAIKIIEAAIKYQDGECEIHPEPDLLRANQVLHVFRASIYTAVGDNAAAAHDLSIAKEVGYTGTIPRLQDISGIWQSVPPLPATVKNLEKKPS